MDINPQEVIAHLSNEISRLNVELAMLKALISQQQKTEVPEDAAS